MKATRASDILQVARARWAALAAREQTLVLAAGAVVGFALLWWLLVAPAWQTLRDAPVRHAQLDTQLQHMRALQAEAAQLQAAPRAQAGNSLRALQSSLTPLGPGAQLSTAGDRVTVTLRGAPAEALAQWLAEARTNAHALPVDLRLVRSTAAAPNASGTATPPPAVTGSPRWDGTIVLSLPPA